MNFSLLCPTRSRIGSCERLIASLKETVGDFSNVEILFGIDNDDPISERHLIGFRDTYAPVNIRIHKRQQSDFINGDYYNWLAQFAKGEYLQIIGDDCVFKKLYWDKLAKMRLDDYVRKHSDRVIYGMIDDGTPPPRGEEKRFCCFPLFSRTVYETLGFLLHGEIPTWGADSTIYEVFAHGDVDRVLKIPEIEIDHVSHHCDPKIKRDNVSYSIEKIYRKYSSGQIIGRVRRINIPANINVLSAHIKYMTAAREGAIRDERMVKKEPIQQL